ncbi:Cyclin-dependent kinase WEE1 [Handroanthus impetiginosus]|uniref:Wee1-like protein kinase n=1 Tax=Handroanthus impetiginosus TaxID=429701 RepID=A0A2G9GJ95_9LAMI|nr:Cyclin-dependent kinase WEE1 [Handroanthus impetiginosus]
MKRKALSSGIRNSNTKRGRKNSNIMVKGTLANHLTMQLDQVSLNLPLQSGNTSRFQKLHDSEAHSESLPPDFDAEAAGDKDFILSQDFFCTPDYITPEMPAMVSNLDCNKENIQCPKSPEKIKTNRSKRPKLDVNLEASLESTDIGHEPLVDLVEGTLGTDEMKTEKAVELKKGRSFVSQSAMALRCRVMPPPCLKNPYIKDASEFGADPFGNQRSKCAGFYPAGIGGDGLSRYRTDFHEIEKIGDGNFNHVYKVLKRIDGCMYAVKRSMRQLHQDTERRKALMEVQALAALGYHENIVSYYSSWFENEQLYIQLELCDHSLSINRLPKLLTEGEALDAMYQIAKALQFIHRKGIAHLDVKPDNIYVKEEVYKLGDFGCATLIDKSLPIEEGDARYMPHEILNENYDNLDKVDIFSLGASIYELARGSPLPESGPHFLNLKEGKLPLLPGHSLQFQNLIKVMMDADPVRRPSAKELVENPIFNRHQRIGKN